MHGKIPLLVAGTLLTALATSGAIGAVLPDAYDPFPTVQADCHPSCPIVPCAHDHGEDEDGCDPHDLLPDIHVE